MKVLREKPICWKGIEVRSDTDMDSSPYPHFNPETIYLSIWQLDFPTAVKYRLLQDSFHQRQCRTKISNSDFWWKPRKPVFFPVQKGVSGSYDYWIAMNPVKIHEVAIEQWNLYFHNCRPSYTAPSWQRNSSMGMASYTVQRWTNKGAFWGGVFVVMILNISAIDPE